jgi:hypothetical protein
VRCHRSSGKPVFSLATMVCSAQFRAKVTCLSPNRRASKRSAAIVHIRSRSLDMAIGSSVVMPIARRLIKTSLNPLNSSP